METNRVMGVALKSKFPNASTLIRSTWDKLSRIPGGKKLFSTFVGQMAPYSGTIGALVDELGPGHSRVILKDHRKVRNHLKSVHAIALVNLAEISSGLAMIYGIPDDARGILKGFSIEYLKKARGTLIAGCDFDPPRSNVKCDYEVNVSIYNQDHEIVANAKALWHIGPV